MSGLRARLAEERGFTMILAIMVLLIAMSVGVGAWTAASGDVGNGSYAHDQKRAWAGAEAGVQWYQAQLAQDPSYWSHCTNVPIPTGETSMPVNQKYDGVTPRKWRTIPGATDQFTVELLPAPGSTQCIENNDASMVDPATRTFRIRVTGRPRSGAASCDGATSGGSAAGSCPAKRSIIATFRRSSFLDFLYFSDYETLTPALQNFAALGPNVTSTPTDFQAWAAQAPPPTASGGCLQYWWQGRGNASLAITTPAPARTLTCAQLQFNGPQGPNPGDHVDGPFHTNDSIVVCGTVPFGRGPQDAVEIANGNPDLATLPVGGSASGYPSVSQCGTGGTANFLGTSNLVAAKMQMPTGNSALSGTAYRRTGRVDLTLHGNQFDISVQGRATLTNQAIPASGIIYADNDPLCTTGYDPDTPYPTGANAMKCGDVWVHGDYSQSVTIGAQNDIVINGNLTKNNSTAMLGLVANNYVRIYRPAGTTAPYNPTFSGSTCTSTVTASAPANVTIDAAILAVNGSFVVDNYTCPNPGGTTPPTVTSLTVRGAIAQKYRGPVGTKYASTDPSYPNYPKTGFTKNYVYDDRFHFGSPPKFLDPVQAAWNIARMTEQVPAT